MFAKGHRTLVALALALLAGLAGWVGAGSARAAVVQVRPSAVAYAGAARPAPGAARRPLLGGGRRATLRGRVARATALPATASLRVSLRRGARVRVWAGCGRTARVVLRRSVPPGREKLPVGRISGRAWCFALATDRRVAVDGPRSADPPVLLLAQAHPAAAAPPSVARPAAPKPAPTPAPAPPAAGGAPGTTPFIMAPTSFWNVRLAANVAIDRTATAAAAADLPGEITPGAKAYVNTTTYSSPITVVEPTAPRVPVQ